LPTCQDVKDTRGSRRPAPSPKGGGDPEEAGPGDGLCCYPVSDSPVPVYTFPGSRLR
jgi:hypothetical protein